jgi:thiamine biosynthesis lipoprotein
MPDDLNSSFAEFQHEAMATHWAIIVAGHPDVYARQAAAAAFNELDRLEGDLSRFIESSDIARAGRLSLDESIVIGHDALECLLIAADVSLATGRAFDPAYTSERTPGYPPDLPPFQIDPGNHRLTSKAVHLRLDLGAVGKGYALDRMAEILGEWGIAAASLNSGGSTLLALGAAADTAGWSAGIGEGKAHRELPLTHLALSGSGIAVQGAHVIDPRSGAPAPRTSRTWAAAASAAVADALSTAFFVMGETEIAEFCVAHPETGAAVGRSDGRLAIHGILASSRPG